MEDLDSPIYRLIIEMLPERNHAWSLSIDGAIMVHI